MDNENISIKDDIKDVTKDVNIKDEFIDSIAYDVEEFKIIQQALKEMHGSVAINKKNHIFYEYYDYDDGYTDYEAIFNNTIDTSLKWSMEWFNLDIFNDETITTRCFGCGKEIDVNIKNFARISRMKPEEMLCSGCLKTIDTKDVYLFKYFFGFCRSIRNKILNNMGI